MEEAQGNDPPVPYEPAARPLLDFLKQKQQLEAVRVPAVKGLSRLILDGQPPAELREEIIAAFVDELISGDPSHKVLPAVIAQQLGQMGIMNDASRTPVVADALTRALANKKRDLRVRAECAAALGRMPIDNSINAEMIAYEIANLAEDMAEKFQTDAGIAMEHGLPKNYVVWKKPFFLVYVAFRGDTRANIQREHGLMNKNSLNAATRRSISDAYERVLPLVQAVLTDNDFKEQDLTKMRQWLQANVPQNRKVHNAFQDIDSGEKSAAVTSTAGDADQN